MACIPEQIKPVPLYPSLHVHVKLPLVLSQMALTSHGGGYMLHSSTSRRVRKEYRAS